MTNEEVEQYYKLIYYAMKSFPSYKSKEDLYQAGWLGLTKAYKNYDNNLETKFSTYAYTYIIGEMFKLIEKDRTIKVNRDLTKLKLKMEKCKILLTQKLMREPTIKELSEYLEVEEELLVEAIKASEPVGSIHYSIKSDTKDLLLEDVIGVENKDIDTLIELKEAIKSLAPLDKKILIYNLTKSQEEIGNLTNMSQVKVSRRLTKIRNTIKEKVA